jgi:selenocysteine-specific elongation factor
MAVVATAGHVDHGKSSLVTALTGTDPDRLAEEKRRGLTIDLGFAHTTLPSGASISFIDVPGHVRFLPNMLAGVGGVAGCLFVVAATEGWKAQSEEHLRILDLLGVRAGVIVLTKADLAEPDDLELAQLDVSDHVSGSFLETAPCIPVSSVTGEGLDDVRLALDSLLASLPAERDRGRARLWIDRVFAAKGSGTVVTGTLLDGSLVEDQRLEVQPGHAEVRVRSIQRASVRVLSTGPGERVALNLAGIDHRQLHRGDVLVEPDRWLPTDCFDAALSVLPSLDHEVSRRGSYIAYIGTNEQTVRIRILGDESLAPGSNGAVRVHLGSPLPLLPHDRFVVRESGREETIGGGLILDIAPVTKASRAHPDGTIDQVVRDRGWVTAHELERLTGEVVEPTVGAWVTTADNVAALRATIAERVDAAGSLGFDLALLDERERAVAATMEQVTVDEGRVRLRGATDLLGAHPYLDRLRVQPFSPPAPDGVDAGELRELIRRGDVVHRDGVYFHRETIRDAAGIVAVLLTEHADGFTVAQFRDSTGASRKYSLPLLEELDVRGVTRRRGDLRVGGPRLAAP